MFGKLRDYKGIDTAIATFRQLDLPHVRLLIVGKALKDFDFEGAIRLAEGDPRITVVNETIAADAVSTLFAAADVSLHCYKNITTSGTIPLAQSMGTAIIAPRIGCIQEMVPHSSGILYHPETPFALRNAMLSATQADVQAMGSEGCRFVSQHTVQSFAKKLVEIYRSL